MIPDYPEFDASALARPHAVQFYESPEYLAGVIRDYILEGLRASEPAIAIARREHLDLIENALRQAGADLDRVTFIDARATLDTFMDGTAIDRDAFMTAIGGVLDRASAGVSRIRAYGEMVDLLWRDGNTDAALKLESLWDEIAELYPMSLLCAYSMDDFATGEHTVHFDALCCAHTHVAPAETIGREVTGRDIAMLQQRAKALENEIAQRKRYEADNTFLLNAATSWIHSLDYDARVEQVAALAIPYLADACAVDVERPDGTLERASNAGNVDAPDAQKLVVPMRIGQRNVGVITLVRARPFDFRDTALAVEYARRAAMALENALLYRLAQDSNRTKDQFLATLSHELRTPLTAILGWARMLNMAELEPEMVRTGCATIERSARAQATIIDDLLDLSKIVTGKLSLHTEPVDLMAVIDAALETVHVAQESKAIHVDVASPEERLIVNGDPTRLQQIVWNLLSNAIKFSPAGGRVFVHVERTAESARIVVRDEGEGIPTSFLPYVFDSFRQGDSNITREHGGLGLGLAIVKYLAELHGGSVSASSMGEGRGATFTVTLPLVGAEEAASLPMADLRAIAMLVVHEDRDVCELLAAVGGRAGARVMTASSVEEAEALLAANGVDVIATSIPIASAKVPALVLRKPIDPTELTYAIASAARGAESD